MFVNWGSLKLRIPEKLKYSKALKKGEKIVDVDTLTKTGNFTTRQKQKSIKLTETDTNRIKLKNDSEYFGKREYEVPEKVSYKLKTKEKTTNPLTKTGQLKKRSGERVFNVQVYDKTKKEEPTKPIEPKEINIEKPKQLDMSDRLEKMIENFKLKEQTKTNIKENEIKNDIKRELSKPESLLTLEEIKNARLRENKWYTSFKLMDEDFGGLFGLYTIRYSSGKYIIVDFKKLPTYKYNPIEKRTGIFELYPEFMEQQQILKDIIDVMMYDLFDEDKWNDTLLNYLQTKDFYMIVIPASWISSNKDIIDKYAYTNYGVNFLSTKKERLERLKEDLKMQKSAARLEMNEIRFSGYVLGLNQLVQTGDFSFYLLSEDFYNKNKMFKREDITDRLNGEYRDGDELSLKEISYTIINKYRNYDLKLTRRRYNSVRQPLNTYESEWLRRVSIILSNEEEKKRQELENKVMSMEDYDVYPKKPIETTKKDNDNLIFNSLKKIRDMSDIMTKKIRIGTIQSRGAEKSGLKDAYDNIIKFTNASIDFFQTPSEISEYIYKDYKKDYEHIKKPIILGDLACGLLSLSMPFLNAIEKGELTKNDIKEYVLVDRVEDLVDDLKLVSKEIKEKTGIDMKVYGQDLIKIDEKDKYDIIVMNPPFSGSVYFIDKYINEQLFYYYALFKALLLLKPRTTENVVQLSTLYFIIPMGTTIKIQSGRVYFDISQILLMRIYITLYDYGIETFITVYNKKGDSEEDITIEDIKKYGTKKYEFSHELDGIEFLKDVDKFHTMKSGKQTIVNVKCGLFKYSTI